MALIGLIGTFAATGSAQVRELRNYDARDSLRADSRVVYQPQQLGTIDLLRRDVPDLAVSFSSGMGVTRGLSSRSGYLSAPRRGAALDIALAYLSTRADLLGLTSNDLHNFELRSIVPNSATGATRVYLRQLAHGLPLYNGEIQVNMSRDGRIISIHNAFVRELESITNAAHPDLSVSQAVSFAAEQVGLAAAPGAEATAELMFLAIEVGEARLVWNLQLETPDRQHNYDFNVDAQNGKIWTRFDRVAGDRELVVYPIPLQDPQEGTLAPPADGRSLVMDVADPLASPLGWHDTGTNSFTTLRGNNVHAYEDGDDDNLPPASEPDCGPSLLCEFPIDLAGDPSGYTSASVANLFYWNNIVHDVQYQYGFDEANGNFQVNNFGNGGIENDPVQAEAQDGGGNCNANFFTPPDGNRPRMQMFTCNNSDPARDGALDNGVVVHEYAHGISNRTVGGPLNVNCLNNTQQPGEGWSDLLSLIYTAKASHTRDDPRVIGKYIFGQSAQGPGLRRAPYSTDFAVNDFTYSQLRTQAIPHGVGFLWATIAWDAYWDLVDFHGFDPDLYNASGGSGNQRMMLYMQEGMANTPCSPTFLDARDGIIQAAADNFGGEDVCRLWTAFARRGLGTDATTVGPNSLSSTNGFEIPEACQCAPRTIADAGPDQTVCFCGSTSVGTPAQPSNSYRWSESGETTDRITVAPIVDTTYTVTASTAECGEKTDSATVFVLHGEETGLREDFSNGAMGWTTSGLWHLADASSCANPAPATPPTAMYYGQDSSCSYSTEERTRGSLTSPVVLGVDETSVLRFNYWRRVESYTGLFDVTRVDVIRLSDASKTTVFSLASNVPSQGSWQSAEPISLAGFAGTPIRVEFTFDSRDGLTNDFEGWFIDDVEISSSVTCSDSLRDSLCDNSLFCDGVERCDPMLGCQGGPDPLEDDGIACTVGQCDEASGQVAHVPNDALCDNGLFCDGAERCDSVLGCQDGPDPAGDDGLSCTVSVCDETSNQVAHTLDDVACSDDDPCTEDSCSLEQGCIYAAVSDCNRVPEVDEVRGPLQIRAGEIVQATAVVANPGAASPALGPVTVRFMLSSDTLLDESDTVIGECLVETLPAASSQQCQNDALTIPPGLLEPPFATEQVLHWGACLSQSPSDPEPNCQIGNSVLLVPEPAPTLLMATALWTLGLCRRWRARIQHRPRGS